MRYEEAVDLIHSIGIPTAYRFFPKDTDKTPPYLVYYITGYDDMYADDEIFQRIATIRIEVYMAEKDFDLENRIDLIFKAMGYEKEEVYIDDEAMYEIVYESEVIFNG